MDDSLRITVADEKLRDLLLEAAPADLVTRPDATDDGFTETLYPILVTVGVVSLPAGILAGLIANWISDVLKSGGVAADKAVGLERGDAVETVSMPEDDVERIARKVAALLKDGIANEGPV